MITIVVVTVLTITVILLIKIVVVIVVVIPKPQICKIIALTHNNSHNGHYFTYFWGPGSCNNINIDIGSN